MCRVVVGCALGCGRPHRAFRQSNQLTALPESIGQLTALQKLNLSRAERLRGVCVAWVWTVDGRRGRAVSMCATRRARRGLACVAWS